MPKGQNSSRGGNVVHGRNFYAQQQSSQNLKQAFQMNQAMGSTPASVMGPALNYSQTNNNYNINVSTQLFLLV
jgi:hypothetical protein